MRYNVLCLVDAKDEVTTFGMTRVLKSCIDMEANPNTIGGRAFIKMEAADPALFKKAKMFQELAIKLTDSLLGSFNEFRVKLRALVHPHLQLLQSLQNYYDKQSYMEKKRKIQSQLYTIEEDPAEILQQKLDTLKSEILNINSRLTEHLARLEVTVICSVAEAPEYEQWSDMKNELLQELADLGTS